MLASLWAVVSCTISSSLSTKFDLCNHPDADVLSIWLNRQDSSVIPCDNRSVQIVIMQAKNSSEFKDVLSQQSTGNSKRQARQEIRLYLPNPNSEASDRNTRVGFLKVRLFKDKPSFAESRNFINRCKSHFSLVERQGQEFLPAL